MSYFLKEIQINIKTGKSTFISEKVVDGDYRNGQEDLLVKFFAESCLRAVQEERK